MKGDKHLSEKEHNQKLPTRKKLHVAFVVLFPVLFQIMAFFLIVDWAEGTGSGKGMMGLFAFIMILFALPVDSRWIINIADTVIINHHQRLRGNR